MDTTPVSNDNAFSTQTGRLVQKLNIMIGAEKQGRGARFLARKEAQVLPRFSSIGALPHWVLLDQAQQRQVALTVAALHYRAQIDQEINGAKLGAIADEMGETLFDKSCLAAIPAPELCALQDCLLPRPDQMEQQGMAIMTCALPLEMAGEWPGAQGASQWRPLIDDACELTLSVVSAEPEVRQ